MSAATETAEPLNPFNATLARQILTAIDAQPHLWNQARWTSKTDCGTAMCFAGWACHLGGYHLNPGSALAATPDGVREIPSAASELLGLAGRPNLAQELYFARNSRAALGAMVDELAGAQRLDQVNPADLEILAWSADEEAAPLAPGGAR